jgi:hypothetical protein
VPVYKTSNSGLLTRREYTSFLAGNTQFIPNFTVGAYDSIATTTVGSGGASSVTFSSIPSTYKHLQIRGISRSARSAGNDPIYIRFNSDSGSNYSWHAIEATGSAVNAPNATSATQGWVWIAADSVSPTNVFGASIVDITDYANTSKNKTIRSLGGIDNNGSGVLSFNSALWRSTSAVTSITLTVLSGTNFQQNTQFALYGIKGD